MDDVVDKANSMSVPLAANCAANRHGRVAAFMVVETELNTGIPKLFCVNQG